VSWPRDNEPVTDDPPQPGRDGRPDTVRPSDADLLLSGMRALHRRLDRLEALADPQARLAAEAARLVPAWRRVTAGETRWQVGAVTLTAIALQLPLPDRLVLIKPVWLLPALQGLLFAALIAANPTRVVRRSRLTRWLSLTLATVLSLANAYSAAALVHGLATGTLGTASHKAVPLLASGAAIWLTNVIVFALWYWEFDRGGPVARAHGTRQYPDFQFVQMTSPELAPPDWEPRFGDYLYLAFTNATAFSPTDVMPLSRWAKAAMLVQSAVSIITVALVIARAVNILP
jgi:uncharacterized membrane protein